MNKEIFTRIIQKFDYEPKPGSIFKTVDSLGYGTIKTWKVIENIGKLQNSKYEVKCKLINTKLNP